MRHYVFWMAIVVSILSFAHIESIWAMDDVSLTSVPVREVTVFKDGHAFVTHEGEVATTPGGNATIDYVPTPVIGTFWAHCSDPRAALRSISAGQHQVTKTRSAKQTRELLQANEGKRVIIREPHGLTSGTILKAEADASVVMLRTDVGTKIAELTGIQELTFIDEPVDEIEYTSEQSQLRLNLDWNGQAPAARTTVGMTYLQRGIRWIPSYRLHLDGQGTVRVKMQATLINEMIDLNDVTAHLLVGVPTFEFKDTIDPIALKRSFEQLSTYFHDPGRLQSQLVASNFSNSMMLNTYSAGNESTTSVTPSSEIAYGPEIAAANSNEDLFVYTVNNITLHKGDRMIVLLGEWEMKYEDIYRLEIDVTPPNEIRQYVDADQMQQIAQSQNTPKAQHVIRIHNGSDIPLTTAPVLFVTDQSVLGQGMMTYAPPSSKVDVGLTTALGIAVTHAETEVQRTVERKADDQNYIRAEFEGRIRLTNFQKSTVRVEVIRNTMGQIISAEPDGDIRRLSALWHGSMKRPAWWSSYSWPSWWFQWNSPGSVEWSIEIPAGDDIDLTYRWLYFWKS